MTAKYFAMQVAQSYKAVAADVAWVQGTEKSCISKGR